MPGCIVDISTAVINVSPNAACLSPNGATVYYTQGGNTNAIVQAAWPSDPDGGAGLTTYVSLAFFIDSGIAARSNGDIYYLEESTANWRRTPAGGGASVNVASAIGVDYFAQLCYSYADDVFYAVESILSNDVYKITPGGTATQIISNINGGRPFCTIDGVLWWYDFTGVIHRWTQTAGHTTIDPSDNIRMGGPCASPDTAIWATQTGSSTKHVAKTTSGITYTTPFPGCDDPATYTLPNGTDYPLYDQLYLVPGIVSNGGDGSDRWYTISCAAAPAGRWGVNEVVMG